jgi:hypothetical protein
VGFLSDNRAMLPLILLDFDGVLFNSAYEAFVVCQHRTKGDTRYRQDLSFEEFMVFRANLTDAWQFCRLYQKGRVLSDFSTLHELKPDDDDWRFSEGFFASRSELLQDPDWAKLMSPYPFFHHIRPSLVKYPLTFKILSTRNHASIKRTLEYFELDGIEICGQESIREHGSKLGVAKSKRWLGGSDYVVYIDDMRSHLKPFQTEADFCMHAGWGYDKAGIESYTEAQASQIIGSLLKLAYE